MCIGHSGAVGGSGTFRADAGKILQITHNACSAFLGSGMTMNGFSMACRARATCSASGHVEYLGCCHRWEINGQPPHEDIDKYGVWYSVPAVTDSSSAATVFSLVFPALQKKLMLVWEKCYHERRGGIRNTGA